MYKSYRTNTATLRWSGVDRRVSSLNTLLSEDTWKPIWNLKDSCEKQDSQVWWTSDREEGLPFKREITLSIQLRHEWLMDNSVNVFEWPSLSLCLNPIKYFWRNVKMALQRWSLSNLKRAWEDLLRRMAENPQLQMCKACLHHIPQKTSGWNHSFNSVLS